MAEFFPILRHPEFRLPWAVIAPYAAQAQRNHYQSLEQLAQRGGLSFTEAFCVLTDTHWSEVAHNDANERRARERIEGMIAAHHRAHGVQPSDGGQG